VAVCLDDDGAWQWWWRFENSPERLADLVA
jgi:hypothetical protein